MFKPPGLTNVLLHDFIGVGIFSQKFTSVCTVIHFRAFIHNSIKYTQKCKNISSYSFIFKKLCLQRVPIRNESFPGKNPIN